ncbi:family 20 glycosylhydrolase [Echinicola sediminis]
MLSIFRYTLVLFVLLQTSCGRSERETKGPGLPKKVAIIPQPASLVENGQSFALSENTVLQISENDHRLEKLAAYFNEKLKKTSGWTLKEDKSNKSVTNSIRMQLDPALDSLGDEGYQLNINADQVILSSSQPAGLFYALQSLIQLLPDAFQIEGGLSNRKSMAIAGVEISDAPKFGWRGYMLDVSRHFFDKEEVKKVLDFMAELKLNRFHWHLTDDQGWRIEIKKYPKLTDIGAWRVDHNTSDESTIQWWGRPGQKESEKASYGGYYTQEDIKEIVAYAKDRNIEVLPEIDVPGHSQAILASYPEVSCEPHRKFYVATGGVARDNALCASNPLTYQFLEDVLGEVMDLFPLNYIHIGGDECNKEGWNKHHLCQEFMKKNGLKDEKELQSHFIKEIEKIVNAQGKNLIGWNEILEGGLAPNATVMSWQGEHGGIEAAKAGHDVIMTPMEYVYLDLRQGQADYEPNLGYSEALLSTCYNYQVIPEGFSQEEASKILGLQGNLWTESISDWGKLTYMTYPRLFAVAENGWTDESQQNFDDFMQRLKPHLKRLDLLGVRYAKSVFNPWIRPKGNGKTIEISLDSELTDAEIRYTLDGSDPKADSPLYSKQFELKETKTLKAAIFEDGKRLGDIIEDTFPVHKAASAQVINLKAPADKATTEREIALTDLNYGELEAPGDTDWQGYADGLDVELVLDKPMDIKSVEISSLRLTIFGNYPPLQVEVFGASEGGDFIKIGDSGYQENNLKQGRNKIRTKVNCPAEKISRIRVSTTSLDPIPDWHNRPGGKANLLVDEILVL